MIKTLKDIDLENKKVIIRCDLNVPIKDGVILDDNRIKESLKTIKYVLEKNAKVIILSHLGRIKEKEDLIKNSLLPVSIRLSELLGINVKFIKQTRGSVLEREISKMNNKEVILVENTRFEDYPLNKESKNDEELGKYWASLGDVFINDAFGTVHRAHASNVGIASHLPSAIGFLVEKEIKMLGDLLDNPSRPYIVIMGGSKMNDKIKVIDKLIEKADFLLLAGGIANTFLKALDYDIKESIYDEKSISHARKLYDEYKDKIILPVDGYGSTSYSDGLDVKYSSIDKIDDGIMILDIGPKTVELFSKYIMESKTVFWNGPVGVCEFKNFEYGTKSICKALKNSSAKVVVGGGDSSASIIKFGYKDSFEHISTGGGASLEFIENQELPAIKIIKEKE